MFLPSSAFRNVAFETPLRIERAIEAVRRDGARVEAILLAPYRVSFDWRNSRWSLTVPAGFKAAPSVPPALHGIVPFWGALFEASICHDYAYWTRCFDTDDSKGGRSHADALLASLMRSGGADFADTAEVYTAVNAFGGSHYFVNAYQPKNGLKLESGK
ncbi:MAG: DUF1353 domain-containing protein [Rhodospirillaceae bacterium]|nr:DUF1353 domain-containing protein [Rhodospirillaceae bacterium]